MSTRPKTTRGRPKGGRSRRGDGELLRAQIMDATERLLLHTQDTGAVSIRGIAAEVGCTPPAIYMHFEDKTELIYEVCERHFRTLHDLVGQARDMLDDPLEALKAMGRAYIRFGVDNPEIYRVCFMSKIDEESIPGLGERLKDATKLELVVEIVTRCMDDGLMRRDDPYVVACGVWAAVHGITSLLVAKPFFPWPSVDTLVEHCIQTHALGLAGHARD